MLCPRKSNTDVVLYINHIGTLLVTIITWVLIRNHTFLGSVTIDVSLIREGDIKLYLPHGILGQEKMPWTKPDYMLLSIVLSMHFPRTPCDSCEERMGIIPQELISLCLSGSMALLGKVFARREPSALSRGGAFQVE